MDVANASTSVKYFTPMSTSTDINNPVVNGIYCQNINGQNNFSTILSQIVNKNDLTYTQNNFSDPEAYL
jgi:hypothetical protein